MPVSHVLSRWEADGIIALFFIGPVASGKRGLGSSVLSRAGRRIFVLCAQRYPRHL